MFFIWLFRNKKACFSKGSCNFSWFYKIPHLLKWLNLPFMIYLLLYWCYQRRNFFGKTKVYLPWETKLFFDGKPKMTKNLNLKSWKFQILIFSHFGRFSIFQIQFFFVIFGFPSKKYFFLKANILLSYQKHFWDDSVNREEDIL